MGKFRRVLAATLAVTLSLIVVGCTEPATKPLFVQESPSSPPALASAGLAGIGDPYFPTYGNSGYDVQRYALAVTYEPSTKQLTGLATITANATQQLNRFHLDFHGLQVRSIKVDGQASEFAREGDELIVSPLPAIASGAAFTVEVAYDGEPNSITNPGLGITGFIATPDGAFAIGEPESATSWFPVNDHPRDKALYAIDLTVPDGLNAISNGVLEGKSAKDGKTTWRWRVNAPMASYLATLAIGNYRVVEGTHEGKPVITAVAASIPIGPVDQDMARTTEIADFLASKFGPYPFDAYGGIVIDDDRIRFALETQTRPIYSDSFWGRGRDTYDSNTIVIAHELTHQWFGDSVSVDTWQHIWLNEGFATYAQWLWAEHIGQSTPQVEFDTRYANRTSPLWQVAPAEPGRENIFSRSVYERGAMALHVLRKDVGDDKFFEILRTWAAEQRDGLATTDEFIALSERLAGKQLDPLFDAWLFQERRP